jgi:predicted transposase YdaD
MEFEKKEFDIKNSSQEEIEKLYGLSSVSILKNKVMFYEACERKDIT